MRMFDVRCLRFDVKGGLAAGQAYSSDYKGHANQSPLPAFTAAHTHGRGTLLGGGFPGHAERWRKPREIGRRQSERIDKRQLDDCFIAKQPADSDR